MRRSWALASTAAGLLLMGVSLATFAVEFAEHDVAEGIGLLALLAGLLFLWEGGFSLWRVRHLGGLRDKPK